MVSISTVDGHMKKVKLAVRPDMEVYEAVTLLLNHRISSAPVVNDDGTLVGILAERDCLEAFVNEEYYDSPTAIVRDLMSSKVVAVGPDVGILEAAGVFSHHKFHSLPVVTRQRLVGEISRTDVIRAILEMHQEAVGG